MTKRALLVPLAILLLLPAAAVAQDDFEPLDPGRAEEVLEWLREHEPDWFEELTAWRKKGEEERFHRTLRKFERVMEERHDDPDRKPEGGDRFEARLEKALRFLKEHEPDLAAKLHRLAKEGRHDEVARIVEDFERHHRRESGGEHEPERHIEELLERIHREMPDRAAHLRRLLDKGVKEEFHRELEAALRDLEGPLRDRHREDRWPRVEDDPVAREKQEHHEKLERHAEDLARKVRASDGEERQQLSRELRDNLEQLFEVREWFRHRELERLEKELAEMRRVLEDRQESKERIIERKFREMVGEGHLDW